MERLDRIMQACRWVEAKGAGTRDACKVTTLVKWANWDKKEFSPAMCVLWWSEVQNSCDSYDTFLIPNPDQWISKVAHALDTTEGWVKTFVEQCYLGDQINEAWTVSVTFNGTKDHQLKNPKVEWKKERITNDFLLEVQHCLDSFGTPVKELTMPYWTKDPPVDLYKNKLLSAVRDLFEARKAAEID